MPGWFRMLLYSARLQAHAQFSQLDILTMSGITKYSFNQAALPRALYSDGVFTPWSSYPFSKIRYCSILYTTLMALVLFSDSIPMPSPLINFCKGVECLGQIVERLLELLSPSGDPIVKNQKVDKNLGK
jgi:hypothetical protein